MGYGAYIKCSCYKDGKIASRPPFEEFVKEDEKGIFLNLDWETNSEKHDEFDAWKYSNLCEHHEMEFISERLTNISGMNSFQEELIELGTEKYPILSEHLPIYTEGYLPLEYTETMQKELENLKQEAPTEELIVLTELITNEKILSVNLKEYLPYVFNLLDNVNCSISKKGFQIIRNSMVVGQEFKSILFKSNKFTQEKLSDRRYLYSDVLTKVTFESEINLYFDKEYKDDFFEYELTEVNASIAEVYDFIVEPLLRLTKAAQLTGNPIVWF